MVHEKIFTLYANRLVKLIIKTSRESATPALKVEPDVLIREANEQEFRAPIGTTHPKYWKLTGLDAR